MKLIFEQFRDIGGTIIAAHQTGGSCDGTELGLVRDHRFMHGPSTISTARLTEDAQDAGKNYREPDGVFARLASALGDGNGDLLQRLDVVHADEGLVKATGRERPVLDRQQLMRISAGELTSIVRFTMGSGYTQFGGSFVPIRSMYSMDFDEYQNRKRLSWPTMRERSRSASPRRPHHKKAL